MIHSFFIPNFRMKQAAVPGMVTEMWVTPTKEGRYGRPALSSVASGTKRRLSGAARLGDANAGRDSTL